ncbi:Thrombospondin-4 [Intoshia linei]|uniref:Thrombospondin-4 n=1 Tax=Intoshia linei TaxID=1819745 RepID=A0A177B0Q5_9BILA|nr:Thrombospondin-4 [Intoshia linei]
MIVSEKLYMQSNKISTIKESVFINANINDADLSNNLISNIASDGFTGSTFTILRLNNNEFEAIPGNALINSAINTELFLSYCKIVMVTDNAFCKKGASCNNKKIHLNNNLITFISKNAFSGLNLMTDLKLNNNKLVNIYGASFNTLPKLKKLFLSNNLIVFFPAVYTSTIIGEIDLTNCPVESLEIAIISGTLTKLKTTTKGEWVHSKSEQLCIRIITSILHCDCHLYKMLKGKFNPQCQVNSFSSKVVDQLNKIKKVNFFCSSPSVTTSGTGTSIQFTLSKLTEYSPDVNIVSYAMLNTWMYYILCTSPGESNIEKLVELDTVSNVFTTTINLNLGRTYYCRNRVVMTDGDSELSYPTIVTTSRTAWTNPTKDVAIVGKLHIFNPNVFEFSENIVKYDMYKTNLQHTVSEFGSYVSSDGITTKKWFETQTNTQYTADGDISYQAYNLNLIKKSTNVYEFTLKLITGIVYNNEGTITLGGGNEMWIYINNILIYEKITNSPDTAQRCVQIDLSTSDVTIIQGLLDNNVCTLNQGAGSPVTINLSTKVESGSIDRLTALQLSIIFGCKSQIYMKTDKIKFSNLFDTDYKPLYVSMAENIEYKTEFLTFKYPTTIINDGQSGVLSILEGYNIIHRFCGSRDPCGTWDTTPLSICKDVINIVLDTKNIVTLQVETKVIPTPTVEKTVTINGYSTKVVDCDNLPTPPTVTLPARITTLNVDTANTYALSLYTKPNYEIDQFLILKFKLIRNSDGKIGGCVLQISVTNNNDNCPIIQNIADVLLSPSLNVASVATLVATDADKDTFNVLKYYHLSYVIDPTISSRYNAEMNIIEQVFPFTSSITTKFIVVDSGIPPRASTKSFKFIISNTCVVNNLLELTPLAPEINENSGKIFFKIPGSYIKNFACDRNLGLEKGYILDSQLSASSSNTDSPPPRVRLNEVKDTFSGLSAGWSPITAQSSGSWFLVTFSVNYQITKIMVQGRSDLTDSWIKTFSLSYGTDISNLIKIKNGLVDKIFTANIDKDSVVTISLGTPIITKYVKIWPLTWKNTIGLRLELIGCTSTEVDYYKISCIRCETGFACPGDGTRIQCTGNEYTFGHSTSCLTCLLGWSCANGIAKKCGKGQISECVGTGCSNVCKNCLDGYACNGGISTKCSPGTYSSTTRDECIPCKAGTFQSLEGKKLCNACDNGHFSITGSIKCSSCPSGQYASANKDSCLLCNTPCSCNSDPCFNKNVICVNIGTSSHVCVACPDGYSISGSTCIDIDECTVNSPCKQANLCINRIPGYQCLTCPKGYSGTFEDGSTFTQRRVFVYSNTVLDTLNSLQTCVDVNECTANSHNCKANIICLNSEGSYTCSSCKKGYIGDNIHGCIKYGRVLCEQHQIDSCDTNAECIPFDVSLFTCQCKVGYTGDGYKCGLDTDLDGIPDENINCYTSACNKDNCKLVPNYDQKDDDSDGIGNVCDNCLSVSNFEQIDTDGDGKGDLCDTDDDDDTILDTADNCPLIKNVDQKDTDVDTIGDACDNCVNTKNADQLDTNFNNVGDACDVLDGSKDKDFDGILDDSDNCPSVANSDQVNLDSDGFGDLCDDDIDNDGIINVFDTCPYYSNAGNQKDLNIDGYGDECESDFDKDGLLNNLDAYPLNKLLSVSSFEKYTYASFEENMNMYKAYDWISRGKGRSIVYIGAPNRNIIGAQIYSQMWNEILYTGTLYTPSGETTFGSIGFVFSYHSNRRYYLVEWKEKYSHYDDNTPKGGMKGIHIKLVNSNSAPSQSYKWALWESSNSVNSAIVGISILWTKAVGWEKGVAYKWSLEHRPSEGIIKLKIYKNDKSLIISSGIVYDFTLRGGKIGLYTFQQKNVHWTNLDCKSLLPMNKAVRLYGRYVDVIKMPNIDCLHMKSSLTVILWVKVPSVSKSVGTSPPFFCTGDKYLCIYLNVNKVKIDYGGTQVFLKDSNQIVVDVWTKVAFVIDVIGLTAKLYVNDILVDSSSYITPADWTKSTNSTVYVGGNLHSYMDCYYDSIYIFQKDLALENIKLIHTIYDIFKQKKFLTYHASYNNDKILNLVIENQKCTDISTTNGGIYDKLHYFYSANQF